MCSSLRLCMFYRDGQRRDIEKVSLLSIYESKDESNKTLSFGVSLCDPTTGYFRVGHISDEENRAQLRTLLARENPAEISYERRNLSKETLEVINHMCPVIIGKVGTCLHTEIARNDSFTSEGFVEKLVSPSNGYFSSVDKVPDILRPLANESGSFPTTTTNTMRAFDIVLRVLERALIAHELVTMNQFDLLELPGYVQKSSGHQTTDQAKSNKSLNPRQRMVMDGQALLNLQIMHAEGNDPEATLYEFLNKCKTSFGKRQLREWICSPLFNRGDIIARQNIVKELVEVVDDMDGAEVVSKARNCFSRLYDLERLLSRIHALGLIKLDSHPDSEAVLYENEKYNKNKIRMLVNVLQGLKQVVTGLREVCDYLEASSSEKFLSLKQLLDSSVLETVKTAVVEFEGLFDLNLAKQEGTIKPLPGVMAEYDDTKESVKELKACLDQELELEKEKLGTPAAKQIKYWHPANGKDIYQVQVPDAALPKNRDAPSHWKFMSKKKGYRRFHTKRITTLTAKLTKKENELESLERDSTRAMYEKFDQKRSMWSSAVSTCCDFDCLLSLAIVSSNTSEQAPMCIPEILDASDCEYPIFEAEDSRHPVVEAALEKQGQSFIPNSISLGNRAQSCLLLTGPNMGGKSTLLRQTCIISIMAQIGCFVPAKSCRMTPVDRIFTRIGASDRIMSGQSTFYVELDETSTILHGASKHSLIILDELGRGTSTFDGTAIAYAVVKKLCEEQLRCRTLFATHYHTLVQDFASSKAVKLAHMACFADSDESVGSVTFLYKLESGPRYVD